MINEGRTKEPHGDCENWARNSKVALTLREKILKLTKLYPEKRRPHTEELQKKEWVIMLAQRGKDVEVKIGEIFL